MKLNRIFTVFTIYGINNTNTYVSYALFLLFNKFKSSYKHAFEFLIKESKQIHLYLLPTMVYVDFKMMTHSAVQKTLYPHTLSPSYKRITCTFRIHLTLLWLMLKQIDLLLLHL